MNNTNSTSKTAPDDNEVLRYTFSFYGALLVIIFVTFCVLRRLCPRPYTIRKWVDDVKTRLANDQFGLISWIWRLNSIKDEEILAECGMDALCFLRVFRFGFRIAAMGIWNSVWLFAVYATSPKTAETSYIKIGVLEITIANVPPSSPRFLATVIAAYLFFGYTMYLLLKELEWYIDARHKFLQRPTVRNYSIFCRNIPPEFRSNAALSSFFDKASALSSVLQASMCVKTSNLAKVIAERDNVLIELERAMFISRVEKKTPRHKKSLTGEEVDSIPTYSNELTELNDDVKNRIEDIRSIIEKNDNIKPDVTDDTEMDASSVYMESGMNRSESLRQSKSQSRSEGVTEKVKETASKAENAALSTADSLKAMFTENDDGEMLPAGFVTFTKLSSVHSSLQTIQHNEPFAMETMAAPEPQDVLWANVGKSNKAIQTGTLISAAATAALCLFWTIPIAFFASLSSVSGLRKAVPPIDALLNAAPALEPVLQVLAPYLVVAVNSMLPVILVFLSKTEGWVSNATVSASAFTKLASFMIIQTFFVSAISGSILDELVTIINSPTQIVTMLANTLPAQSTYFIQIIFVSTVIPIGMELLRVLPILYAFIRGFVGPRTLEKDREKPFIVFRPLSNPIAFNYAAAFSQLVLYFMVLFVYAVMSPLTAYIVGFCFLYMAAAYRHQFVYVYPKVPDSGGKMYAKFISVLLVCVLIAEVTIIGFLALKKSSIGVPLLIPLILMTIMFTAYVRKQHFRIAEILPALACSQADQRNDTTLDLNPFYDAYVQPELLEDERKHPDVDDEVDKALTGNPNNDEKSATLHPDRPLFTI